MVITIYNYAEIIIRRAQLSEVDLIREIIKEAYMKVKKQLSRTPGALQENLSKISRNIQMGTQYVALVGDTVVGCMRVQMTGNAGVISRVAVRNEFRKRRIGTRLVDYGENLLDHMNASYIDIEVYGAIDAQREFYEKLGYEELERTIREGEEIVVMRKSLMEEDVIEDDI
ncbi:MAG: GNAT family N-acetyltransferase [Candidatus Thorarchaeota archaeon]|nr:GNAT family N-acetyltransferase [Candidatus Thorarchaeota archaeon]